MEAKIIFLSGSGILALSIIFAIVLSSSAPDISPNQKQDILEECKSLTFNGEDKINLVFFGKESEAIEYSDYLFSTEPFKSNSNEFNLYLIDERVYEADCEIYRGQALLCDNSEVRKKAASCPNDFIFVLRDSGPSMRSSARGPTASINTNNNVPKNVLLHEFGHTFANLAEEYLGAGIPKGSKNCPVSCDDFQGLENGCFEGCSTESRVRSIDRGIMRTLWDLENPSAPFGEFNDNLIVTEINSKPASITGFVVSSNIECQNQEYIYLEGEYFEDNLHIIEKSIYPGCAGTNGKGDYSYILNYEKELIKTFNPNFIFTDGQSSEEEEIHGETFQDGNIILTLPYTSRNYDLEIRSPEGEIILETTLADAGARPCRK